MRLSVPRIPLRVVTAVALGALATLSTPPARADVPPGQYLSGETWRQAEGMFPPELLEHFKRGEMKMIVKEFPPGGYVLDKDIVAAGEKNIGRFMINEQGSLVEKATGKIPEYNFGVPFAKIDPKSPTAAQEIIWNYFYAYWAEGNNFGLFGLDWVNADSKTPERSITLTPWTKLLEGNPIREDNPMQMSLMARVFIEAPADVHGTQTLSWRFKDADKQDNNWAYVPALRRVRELSPVNRADGTLGSDMSQDDGFNGFDAKPETFNFKLIGEGAAYHMFFPPAVDGNFKFEINPPGGYRYKVVAGRWCYTDPECKLMPWAPMDNALVKRPVWIIEATPKDPYYPFRKWIFTIDKETYRISTVAKYDQNGGPMAAFARVIAPGKAPDGHQMNYAAPGGGTWAENTRLNRATTSYSSPDEEWSYLNNPQPIADFQTQKLMLGK